MKRYYLLALLLHLFVYTSAQDRDLTLNEKIAIKNLEDHIISNRIDVVAKQISYPLCRNEYFNYIIDSEEVFRQKFYSIFDENQKKSFCELNWRCLYIKYLMDDGGYYSWQASGFCGYFNDNGIFYLDIIPLSNVEKKFIKQLIEEEKLSLHTSIRNYKEPVCLIHVDKYRIRIDRMHDESIRYTSWKTNAPISAEPDIIIYNGKTFGNRWHTTFEFTNAGHEYILTDAKLYGSPVLSITKGDTVLFETDYDVEYSFKYFYW